MRAAVYHRVSSEQQVDGFSLDAQQRATRLHCEGRGWTIAGEYRDEGKSARTDDLTKRPAFAAMLADAEAGMFDVIVVHKLDRFSRNVIVTLQTFERLSKANVGFVAISQNMDFTSAMGKVQLAILAAFAQLYSDNLSEETKKGKAERKRQGFYNGHLPFGVKKNADGLPVPDPETYPGLLLAFSAAADGKSDREVAQALNAAGYRTTGSRGVNPFTKDSVKVLLTNRFYLGELPDTEAVVGKNGRAQYRVVGWLPAKHAPMLDSDLFDAAQAVRADNRTSHAAKVRNGAQVYSFSGLARCGHCGGPLHVLKAKGRPRLYCYNGNQGGKCAQRSTFLDVYEDQIADYLATFTIPEDYRAQIIDLHAQSKSDQNDAATRRWQIDARLARIKELYGWGDIERDAYQSERDALTAELATIRDVGDQFLILEKTAGLLADMPSAWAKATQEQRNRLAGLMFEGIVVENRTVAAVRPRPDFACFLALDYFERLKGLSGGSDGIRTRGLSLDRAAC